MQVGKPLEEGGFLIGKRKEYPMAEIALRVFLERNCKNLQPNKVETAG